MYPERGEYSLIFHNNPLLIKSAISLEGLSFTAPLERRDVIVDLDLSNRLKVDEVM